MSGEAGLAAAFFAIALVYAAVGQAGASGYLAAMAFFGFAPLAMKTTALALNVAVAAIGAAVFLRAGRLCWRNVYPFALLGAPFSLLGGAVQLPGRVYFPALGAVLILSALQMARGALRRGPAPAARTAPPPFVAALLTGGAIGFVSGTTGAGGGVFLAPAILAMGWAGARETAATTAAFNLMNSAAALLGAHAHWGELPTALPWWLAAAACGGTAGALLGSRLLSDRWLRGVLALLLGVSGLKLLW